MLLRQVRSRVWWPWCTRQVRNISDLRPFAYGDNIILENTTDRYAPHILCNLRPGKIIENHKGIIKHEDIVGKRVRSLVTAVQTSKKATRASQVYRVYEASLDEWVRYSERVVTPLYPSDANLIVNLLDLHPDPPHAATKQQSSEPRLEILEAGTGHGSLTLYLSRAIHAANPPLPDLSQAGTGDVHKPENPETGRSQLQSNDPRLEEWRNERRAVLHTIEVSPKHSKHAQRTVSGFRNGMYARNVDFHIGDVSEWIQHAMSTRGSDPFLSHVILDLPSAPEHFSKVTDALRVNGTLIVFAPSITQITECATHVKQSRLELDLQTVIELGVNGGTGGREWDVRFTRVRNSIPVRSESTAAPVTEGPTVAASDEPALINEAMSSGTSDGDSLSHAEAPAGTPTGAPLHLVCRPKVGERIVGGGFLGVWRKRRAET
jgi:tRNA A58 N-methylase Trm61